MNFYLIFIISALTVEFVLNRITGYLNITSLSPELPEEFKNSYDESKYKNSQYYTRTNEQFDVVTGTFDFFANPLCYCVRFIQCIRRICKKYGVSIRDCQRTSFLWNLYDFFRI